MNVCKDCGCKSNWISKDLGICKECYHIRYSIFLQGLTENSVKHIRRVNNKNVRIL